MAESSSKHFAMIRQTNSNSQSGPRILNTQKRFGASETSTTHDFNSGKQWIEISNQNMDVTLKSEVVTDEEKTCISPVVYMVDVNGADGDIEVKPRSFKESNASRIIINKPQGSRTPLLPTISPTPVKLWTASENNESIYECTDDDQNEHSDAISFLLNNKHLKTNEDSKNEAYHNRKYECTVCAKKFVGKSNLVDHLRYHANIRNYKCNYCDKTFVQSGSLKSHLRTHTAEKPFVCCYCNKGFGQKSALTVHIRTHTQERRYVCETCSKAFMTTGDLIKHKLIHQSIKKFSCEICGMRSAQKVNIKKHKLKVHGVPEESLNKKHSELP